MAKPATSGPRGELVALGRDDLCLAFANTLSWRGSDPPKERLHALSDLVDWLASPAGLSAPTAPLLQHRRGDEADGAALFAEAVELREALYRIFTAVASSREPRADDMARLNAALERTPARARLAPLAGSYAWEIAPPTPAAPDLLAPILWSAGDLLVGPRRARVRQCANEKCLWLFLDDSKSGTRRWCSMETCGNRAKAHRHYLRTKEA
jgi:predicted RNA-binding Zn ribbon-like protein